MSNFVKSFNIFGTEAIQITCITLHGSPDENTQGAIGIIGMDVDSQNKDLYKCVGIDENGYIWGKIDIPTKVSDLENDKGYLDESHTHKATDVVFFLEDGITVDYTLQDQLNMLSDNIGYLYNDKADKLEVESWFSQVLEILLRMETTISTIPSTAYAFEFGTTHNAEIRLAEATNISFTFGDGEYELGYTSGLSFDSGANPTAIDYTDSGILNWVGTDCTMSNGLSIFQPSANTHYDIVFYFNGTQFIGLVNGFVSSIEWQGALPTGNEAV